MNISEHIPGTYEMVVATFRTASFEKLSCSFNLSEFKRWRLYNFNALTKSNLNFSVWPRGYKTFSMLNSAEHETYPAHKC